MWKNKKTCPKCFSINTVKKGIQKKTGKQKLYCKSCQTYFTDVYSNNGFKRDFVSRVQIELSNNSVRKTAKILSLSPATVHKYRNKVSPDNKIPVLDIFSGIGGFSLGFERTGRFKTVAFCEIDEKARMVLDKHWPDVNKYNDVREITLKQLMNDGIERPKVICGGFPCQDISIAGQKEGIDGRRSGLWGEYKRLISEIRPDFAVVENVRNLLSGKRGTWFGRVLGDLAEIGYDAEWNVISAARVGARHLRERVWIVAYPRMLRRGDNITRRVGRFSAAEESKVRCPSSNEITGSSKRQKAVPNTNCKWQPQQERHNEKQRGRHSNCCEKLSDSDCTRLENWISKTIRKGTFSKFERLRREVPNTNKFNDDNGRYGASQVSIIKPSDIRQSKFWETEPAVGRVVNGIPGRVDRLKQLGNSVVPQIPELIANAILNFYTDFIIVKK